MHDENEYFDDENNDNYEDGNGSDNGEYTEESSSLQITTQAPAAINSVKEFGESVKTMCELQNQIKEIAKQRKAINDRVNELKGDIQEYMINNKVKKCNYDTDEIYVNKRVANGSLTRVSLKKALDSYDETVSEDMFNFVVTELGTREVIELKRRKRKDETKKPAARAVKAKK